MFKIKKNVYFILFLFSFSIFSPISHTTGHKSQNMMEEMGCTTHFNLVTLDGNLSNPSDQQLHTTVGHHHFMQAKLHMTHAGSCSLEQSIFLILVLVYFPHLTPLFDRLCKHMTLWLCIFHKSLLLAKCPRCCSCRPAKIPHSFLHKPVSFLSFPPSSLSPINTSLMVTLYYYHAFIRKFLDLCLICQNNQPIIPLTFLINLFLTVPVFYIHFISAVPAHHNCHLAVPAYYHLSSLIACSSYKKCFSLLNSNTLINSEPNFTCIKHQLLVKILTRISLLEFDVANLLLLEHVGFQERDDYDEFKRERTQNKHKETKWRNNNLGQEKKYKVAKGSLSNDHLVWKETELKRVHMDFSQDFIDRFKISGNCNTSKKKLSQLPAVDMQKFQQIFWFYSHLSPRFMQTSIYAHLAGACCIETAGSCTIWILSPSELDSSDWDGQDMHESWENWDTDSRKNESSLLQTEKIGILTNCSRRNLGAWRSATELERVPKWNFPQLGIQETTMASGVVCLFGAKFYILYSRIFPVILSPGMFQWHLHAIMHKFSLILVNLVPSAIEEAFGFDSIIVIGGMIKWRNKFDYGCKSALSSNHIAVCYGDKIQAAGRGVSSLLFNKTQRKKLNTVALEDFQTGLGENGSGSGPSSKEEKERIGLQRIFGWPSKLWCVCLRNLPATDAPKPRFYFFSAFPMQNITNYTVTKSLLFGTVVFVLLSFHNWGCVMQPTQLTQGGIWLVKAQMEGWKMGDKSIVKWKEREHRNYKSLYIQRKGYNLKDR
ncbi:putative signal peptide protein [Puccinia sorghi]|uniref:Putative signal peptide protein n=1 Tax=Puccinia sorghi TaxID=27349 RepID=A0A0L6VML9_9BASI|nr:putative signal peptide protein [Puccinia sorghi]